MKFIYNLLISVGYVFALPYLHLKMNRAERLSRLGHYYKQLSSSIWIHASSMGEVNAVKELIKKLLIRYPEKDIILTTMTRTGQEAAGNIDKSLNVSFMPLDFIWIIKRFFKKINPDLLILVETEFWPNMLSYAKRSNVPVLLVNGRISQRSFPQYKRSYFFWKPFWKAISAVAAQSMPDKKRFEKLGFKNVENYENIKFCLNLPEYDLHTTQDKLNIGKHDFILVWGSSRPGEEQLLIDILPALRKEIKNLKIVVVPRHLNRLDEVTELFSDYNPEKLSNLAVRLSGNLSGSWSVLLVDKMGELNEMYSIADLAIVGGSFFDFGGHNPLEPAFFGKPIIMGQFHHSCRGSVKKLLENEAICICEKSELKDNILHLAKDETLRFKMGGDAKKTLQKNSNSLSKTLHLIDGYLQ